MCSAPRVLHNVGAGFVREQITLSCPTPKGFSGGPVVCNNGVTGVLTGGRALLSMAVATETVIQVFKYWLNISPNVSSKILLPWNLPLKHPE